ncbi:MAG: PorP/SprF family type IX secretion system membrane protein [Eudoraea sp.]|nr:PorP/SprF family type IX secretion system membrane protein [Eudoraea sp.]
MKKGLFIVILVMGFYIGAAQDLMLPKDFRQHNLTEYNSSLFSPVFGIDRNNPESIALWARWQWQNIDTDPSTLLVNYSRMLNDESAMGIGFFQHNTGTYLQTGGAVNYSYVLNLENNASISFGANLFAFSQSLADDQFISNSGIVLPPDEEGNSFLIQLAPSLQFAIKNFRIGIVGENLFDYNFSTNERASTPDDKIYLGFASYDLPISSSEDGDNTYIRPMVYYKNIPGFDDQYGLSAIFSTPKFWVQGGYNSFYGVSGGIGGRIAKKFSIGALAEFGLDEALDDRDPSFEIVTAYYLGNQDRRKKVVGFEVEDDEEILVPEEEVLPEEVSPTVDEILEEERLAAIAAEGAREEERIRREEQVQDSISRVREAEIEAARAEEEKPQEGEKYQESTITKEGVAPGFYLIVNVFGKKIYYDAFMKKLQGQGLNPKSFLRPQNNYNYVYLQRYDTMSEARRARNSKFDGRYTDDMWIFGVVPD